MNINRTDLFRRFGALAGLLALVIAFSFTSPAFHTFGNAMTVSLQVSSIVYLGIGATFVILTGGIDLSVGSVLALSGVVAALSVRSGIPVAPAMLLGIAAGAACGVVNGLCITRLGLPPFIATLGMMLVARGIALQATGARAVSGLGEAFGRLGNGSLWRIERVDDQGFPDVTFPGIPYPVLLMAALAIASAVLLARTRLGRHIHAVGSNAEAARLSGVDVRRVVLFSYVVSGALAGLAGCVLMSRLVTAQPSEGAGYELDAIAAAVIGGTSLLGGIGTITGTIIGSFVIGVLRNGLNMNGVSSFSQQIVIGVVILLAVWIDQLRNRR